MRVVFIYIYSVKIFICKTFVFTNMCVFKLFYYI